MLCFIDTHAHLNFKDYQNELDDVIKRSLKTGVEKIICVSSNLADSQRAVELTQKYPGMIFAAAGIHPQCTDPENKDSIEKQLGQLEDLVKTGRVVAIGECGLDNTDPPSEERKRSIEEQKELFLGQLLLAKKYNLPVLIHCNKAYEELLKVFDFQFSILAETRGIFHFYTGGKKRLKNFLEFKNFYFGITGTVTYDEGIVNVIKEIPLGRLVLETDCPFLAPLPYRGQRNEPSFISLIAKKIAEIKNTTIEEVAKMTTANAEKVFGI